MSKILLVSILMFSCVGQSSNTEQGHCEERESLTELCSTRNFEVGLMCVGAVEGCQLFDKRGRSETEKRAYCCGSLSTTR